MADTYVVIGDNSVASNNGVVFFYADSTGQFRLVGPRSDLYFLASYVANQWYRVDLTLDWVGRTVDVFIDGVARQYNVPFRSPATRDAFPAPAFSYYDNSTALARWTS